MVRRGAVLLISCLAHAGLVRARGGRPPARPDPTGERFRERVRNPEGEHLIRPNVFGVGWTVHLANVVALVRRGVSSASPG